MTETIYRDGEFVDVSAMGDEPFIYQYIRADGYSPHHVQRHIDLIDAASWRIRHCASWLSVAEVSDAIGRLLVRNGYPDCGVNIVLLRSYAEGRTMLSCCGTSLYNRLTLRALRPAAITVTTGGVFVGLPTSAELAETKMLSEYVRTQGVGAFVSCDGSGRVVSVDGATPIVVKGGKIAVSRLSLSVEAEAVMHALELAGRSVEMRDILCEELSAADEVWGADYRGITSLAECDGRIYADIVADAVARTL